MKKILLIFCICFIFIISYIDAKEWNKMKQSERIDNWNALNRDGRIEFVKKWIKSGAKYVVLKGYFTMPTIEGVKEVYNLWVANCHKSAENLVNRTAGGHIIKGNSWAKIIRYIDDNIVQIEWKEDVLIYGFITVHKQYTLKQALIPVKEYNKRFMR